MGISYLILTIFGYMSFVSVAFRINTVGDNDQVLIDDKELKLIYACRIQYF